MPTKKPSKTTKRAARRTKGGGSTPGPGPTRRVGPHPPGHTPGDGATPSTAPPGDVADARTAPLDPGRPPAAVPVVGVGASAGGLEAFSQLLEALPATPGLAVVLVQHLSPEHDSALTALLGPRSAMPVVDVQDGMRVVPDRVYVMPANVQLSLDGDVLRLSPRPFDRAQHTPIDHFFHTLAASAGDRAVAVVLSGSGSDGAYGVREVKAAGGTVMVQTPETTRHDGMPRAAIATDLVDLVLPPNEIAAALVQLARHPYLEGRTAAAPAEPVPTAKPAAIQADQDALEREALLGRVFALLRGASGVDFKAYKRPTIERRIQRRMALHRLTRLAHYVRMLDESHDEVVALFHDLLILVTRFFRDPDAFAALTAFLFPRLLEQRAPDDPIRVWVAGCSTGEEAYSVAIVLLEAVGEATVPIQIFATDVSDAAVEKARAGFFPATIEADVSAARRRRFFAKTDGGYRISKAVRDVCVFARQDLTRDPPFSKLDVIVCRNVLIYMSADLQQKLMGIFHYALKPGGALMLGSAETIGQHSDLFRIEDKRHRLYSKKPVTVPTHAMVSPYAPALPPVPARAPHEREDSRSVVREADRVVQDRYAPPGVVVDAEMQIVQFRGHTGPYLEPAPGDASLNILKMVREGLLYAVRTALHATYKTGAPVRKDGLRVRRPDGWHDLSIDVVPLAVPPSRPHALILFREAPGEPRSARARSGRAPAARGGDRGSDRSRIEQLQQELDGSRDYLQSIIQELEAANEELQSANEEVMSANEELQSTNEELDTAKEELQSTNEELNTVNDELLGRNEELSRANSDLVNLLGSVQIAIVIVCCDLRIRRFTPMAERVLNLIPSDVGRPIGHLKPNIDCPDLESIITEVIDTVTPAEREVQDGQGHWFSLRVRPYKDLENRIQGAVLALFDIQAAKSHAVEMAKALGTIQVVLQAVSQPMVLLDADLVLRNINEAFGRRFGCDGGAVRGRGFFEPGMPLADEAALRALVADGTPGRPWPAHTRLDHHRNAQGTAALATVARVGAGPEATIVVSFADDDGTRADGAS